LAVTNIFRAPAIFPCLILTNGMIGITLKFLLLKLQH